MNFETIDNVSIRCNDCLEVMDAEEWQGHKCRNNYQVVDANKTIRAESDCSVCTRYSIEELRAHLRTLANVIMTDRGGLCPARDCISCDCIREDRGTCLDIIIDYAISHPTEE